MYISFCIRKFGLISADVNSVVRIQNRQVKIFPKAEYRVAQDAPQHLNVIV
jgi:hypothetical protein